MSNNDHEPFEVLQELRALNLLDPVERLFFDSHLAGCPQCREALESFGPSKSGGGLPFEQVREHSGGDIPASSLSLKERMLLRARAAGIPVDLPARLFFREAMRSGPVRVGLGMAVLLFAGAAIMSVHLGLSAIRTEQEITRLQGLAQRAGAELAESKLETDQVKKQLAAFLLERNGHLVEDKRLDQNLIEREADLEALQRTYESELAANRSLRQELEQTTASLDQASQRNNQKTAVIEQQAVALHDLRNEFFQQDQALRQLRVDAARYKQMYDQSAELLGASRDIRDLIGAKDLRVVDIMDVPGPPHTATSLGRMFIADERVLVFYAFDLPETRNVLASAKSYQAWGYDSSGGATYQSLGLFYRDGENQRWVLHFNNPDIIREISAVFVTVEPPGGSPRPSGQPLLYAMIDKEKMGSFEDE